MSSLFQIADRVLSAGTKFNIGTGPIVGGHAHMGLWYDNQGQPFAVDNGGPAVAWNGGVPFDANGRVMITTTQVVASIQPGPVPISANGSLVWNGTPANYVHGVSYSAGGALAT